MNRYYKAWYPTFKVHHLSRVYSDHSPLLIDFPIFSKPKGIFRFQRMWLDHLDFLACVQTQWSRLVEVQQWMCYLKNYSFYGLS